MNNNNFLNSARINKKDEFYTYYETIEIGLKNYSFRDKIIYCNCDTEESNFVKYFTDNFKSLGLKKLISTGLYQEYAVITTSNGTARQEIEFGDILSEEYPIGDFRHSASKKFLAESDIVVTNPPFSLWREYFTQLKNSKKQFIILGNINGVSFSEVSQSFVDKTLWLGNQIHTDNAKYRVPEDYPLEASECGVEEDGTRYIKVKSSRWYTNIDFPQRYEKFLELEYSINDLEYKKFDNSDIINVDKTLEIPNDYDGIMGVPITFLDRYNPNQFEILGFGSTGHGVGIWVTPRIDGKLRYWRIFIRKKS